MSTQSHRLMGILNVTPDSFFDGGRYAEVERAVLRAEQMVAAGADIIDIGGESTRPGAPAVSEEDELRRVIPVIQALRQRGVVVPISIDTRKARVASQALAAGATLLNDVSGFRDPEMQDVAATSLAELCIMHMQGDPQSMQSAPHYEKGVVYAIMHWLEGQVKMLVEKGVSPSRIILDPGIGFGKTVAHNIEILQNLRTLKSLGFPVLLGASRKSFTAKILNEVAGNVAKNNIVKSLSGPLSATLTVNTLALMAGVDIIRVHDIKEHRELIDFISYIKTAKRTIYSS